MSHAVLLEALDTGAIWSVARGFARRDNEYKSHLNACDSPRRNDLDGRGTLTARGESLAAFDERCIPADGVAPPSNTPGILGRRALSAGRLARLDATPDFHHGLLSEEALAAFMRFFLETCLGQVRFIEQLVQPDRLRDRMLVWADEEVRGARLPAKAGQILEAVLFRGELPRGDVAALLGTSDRHARRVLSALLARGVLVSDSVRAPLFLTFPAALASRWMPGLFPDKSA